MLKTLQNINKHKHSPTPTHTHMYYWKKLCDDVKYNELWGVKDKGGFAGGIWGLIWLSLNGMRKLSTSYTASFTAHSPKEGKNSKITNSSILADRIKREMQTGWGMRSQSSNSSFLPINNIQRTMPIIKNRRAEGGKGNGNGRNKSGKIRCGLVQVHTPPVNPKDLYTLLSWMRGNLLSFYYTFIL